MDLKLKALFLGLAVLLIGCATVDLPQGPSIYSLKEYPNAPVIGVPKVKDLRESEHAGTIGALGIKVGRNIATTITTNVIYHLNTRMSLNMVQLPEVTVENMDETIEKFKLDGILMADLNFLEMSSMDALMQPVQTNLDMAYYLYNKNKQKIYQGTILGEYNKRIGMTYGTKAEGKLIESAIQDSLMKLRSDLEFRQAIESLTSQNNRR